MNTTTITIAERKNQNRSDYLGAPGSIARYATENRDQWQGTHGLFYYKGGGSLNPACWSSGNLADCKGDQILFRQLHPGEFSVVWEFAV